MIKSCIVLAYCKPSSSTTRRTLPARRRLFSVPSTRSSIGSLRHIIQRAMVKLRYVIAPSLTACGRVSARQKENGSINFPRCSGHTEPRSALAYRQRPSSQSMFMCQHCAWKRLIGIKTLLSSDWRKISLKRGGGRLQSGLQPTNKSRLHITRKVTAREFQIGDLVLKHII